MGSKEVGPRMVVRSVQVWDLLGQVAAELGDERHDHPAMLGSERGVGGRVSERGGGTQTRGQGW
jgi:hypothetical protein